MHELSIAQALVEELEKAARAENATAVTRLTVTVGTLSGVEPEALKMAFPLAAEGTLAGDAELTVESVSAVVRCPDCGETVPPGFPVMACGRCGSAEVEVVSGRELLIRSAELCVPSK